MPRTSYYFGYSAPFIDGAGHVLVRQEDERLIKNDLLQLLLTVPGERVMSPDFGVNLRNFPFEPADPRGLGDLQQEILAKIQKYDSRVLVKNVQVTASPDTNTATVTIVVALITSPAKEFLVQVKIPTGGTSLITR